MSIYRLKGTSGSLINQSFVLQERLLIGAAKHVDIRIDQPGVAPEHAEILVSDQRSVTLRSLAADQAVRVNGTEVQRVDLAGGDEIHIGQCRFLLQAPGLRPQRVLTEQAIRSRRRAWPWLLPVAIGLAGWLAWQQGWLSLI